MTTLKRALVPPMSPIRIGNSKPSASGCPMVYLRSRPDWPWFSRFPWP
jgi:hypothetical protein